MQVAVLTFDGFNELDSFVARRDHQPTAPAWLGCAYHGAD